MTSAKLIVPHEMTFAELREVASVHTLQNHPQRFRVYVDARDYGFSNAATPEAAIADVHHREINNALYFHLPEVEPNGLPLPSIPPAHVVAEYPDLYESYAEILDAVAPAPAQAEAEAVTATVPSKIKVPKLDFQKLDNYRVALADYTLSDREAFRAIVVRDGGQYTVNCYRLRDGACVDMQSDKRDTLGAAKSIAATVFEYIWRRHELVEKAAEQHTSKSDARHDASDMRSSTGMSM